MHIAYKYSSILVHSVDGAACWLKQLLSEPSCAQRLGETGREHVRHNSLLTRHLLDYLLLISLTDPRSDLIHI